MNHQRKLGSGLICLLAGAMAVAANHPSARGPFDAKAREIFEKVISIPTSIGNHKVPEMAEYLAGVFRAAGFPAEDVTVVPFKLPADDTAALVVRYRGDGSGGKPILLLAHMDVVTAKASDWVRDPFKLVEADGFFYGRGTLDVKHGITELTTTFLRLKAERFLPKRDLIIFFSGDEETAQATTEAVAKNHRELIDADFALKSDSGGGTLDDATGKPLYFSLQTAEKTYADFTLTTRNPGGHSSTPTADNAIYDLATALVKVRHLSFPVMWNDTTLAEFKAASKTTPGELGAAMAKFAANPKDETAATTLARNPAYVGKTRTTCVATMLEGGHARNALPQSAVANVNCRIFPGVKVEDVRAALAGTVGEGVTVELVGEPLSSDASPLRPDVIAAVTRVVHRFHPGIAIVPSQASGASDGLVFRSVGIPTYGFDPTFIADKDSFSHGLNERIPVRSFYDGLEMWYLILKDLAGGAKKK
jgi:acetylornithine deacetylase/succinyl-diaminopimelate desuccinylase-like protein